MPALKKPAPTVDTVTADAPVLSQTTDASADAPAESLTASPYRPEAAADIATRLAVEPWWTAGVLQHKGWTPDRIVSEAAFVAALAEVKGLPIGTATPVRLK